MMHNPIRLRSLPTCAALTCVALACVALFAVLALPAIVQAQDKTVAAIGNYSVSASEVDAEFKRAIGNQQPQTDAAKLIRATVLDQLVRRQLVMNFLKRKDYLPNDTRLQVRIDLLDEGLQKAGTNLAEHLAERGISEQKYRELTAWNMGWKAYLERYITDENIRIFFEQHQSDFDGTRVQVAHVLVKIKPDAPAADWQRATEQLQLVHERLAKQEIDFAAAAAEHSQAATSDSGGDLGFIHRRHPMPESFSIIAFSLQPGETSTPVRTSAGMHLIHCLKIEPGTETWQENRDEIVAAMKTYLFNWIAIKELETIKVEFADDQPHFIPGTRRFAK